MDNLLTEKIQGDIDTEKRYQKNVLKRIEEIEDILDSHDCKYELKGYCECFELRRELRFLEKEAYPSDKPCDHPAECVVSEMSEWEQWCYCELCEERLA